MQLYKKEKKNNQKEEEEENDYHGSIGKKKKVEYESLFLLLHKVEIKPHHICQPFNTNKKIQDIQNKKSKEKKK